MALQRYIKSRFSCAAYGIDNVSLRHSFHGPLPMLFPLSILCVCVLEGRVVGAQAVVERQLMWSWIVLPPVVRVFSREILSRRVP